MVAKGGKKKVASDGATAGWAVPLARARLPLQSADQGRQRADKRRVTDGRYRQRDDQRRRPFRPEGKELIQ